MLELTSVRKNKVNLADYNFQLDIESRILLANFSNFDLEVLEEILYSPLKISVKKLSRSLNCEPAQISSILQKLVKTGLIDLDGDTLIVNKERRKYFEFQISRFEDGFSPNMEFLQNLLKQVPIHILPVWYSIPRSSNNIFESITEKMFLTPQIYQRYLMELNFDPILHSIYQDVLSSPDLKISSSDLIAKYNLARNDFEQLMLQLEFNFVCCVTYTREDDHWHEWVTPFNEWREYLLFLRSTETPIIEATGKILRYLDNDFSFLENMTLLLKETKKKPLLFKQFDEKSPYIRQFATRCALPIHAAKQYFDQIIQKILLVKFAERIDDKLIFQDSATEWLGMDNEAKALHFYRHPLNRLISNTLPAELLTERHLREAEKSIKRVLHGNWVLFDEFVRGCIVSLNEDSVVALKKNGRHWKYTLPQYRDEDKALIKATIFEYLFECGLTAIGTFGGKDCFCVTPFGQFFFEE